VKKFLFLLSAIAMMLVANVASAQAQFGAGVKMPLTAGDTVVNTGTSSKIVKITGGFNGATIQANLQLLSGTGAGTVVIQGSVDGVTYANISGISSYTITNTANQSAVFYVPNPLPGYIKILATGSGTESTVLSVWYRTPKYQTQ
jgi:hypothetical protein